MAQQMDQDGTQLVNNSATHSVKDAVKDSVKQSRLSPMTRRRLHNFRANRRGFWSLWIFLALLVITLPAEFFANDKPIVVYYDDSFYVPIFRSYPETVFGGEFETEADYRDPTVAAQINRDGWMIWPIVAYSYKTVAWDLPEPGNRLSASCSPVRCLSRLFFHLMGWGCSVSKPRSVATIR